MKGPVSHGFRVIVEGSGVFSARASSDLLNPEMKISGHPEPFLTGCREEKRPQSLRHFSCSLLRPLWAIVVTIRVTGLKGSLYNAWGSIYIT